jgi:hypothetical protein
MLTSCEFLHLVPFLCGLYDTLDITDWMELSGKSTDEFERKQSCSNQGITSISEFAGQTEKNHEKCRRASAAIVVRAEYTLNPSLKCYC